MKNLRLNQSQCETLHASLIFIHVIGALLLTLAIGLWVVPVYIASYCASIWMWYLLSKDEWVTLFIHNIRIDSIRICNNGYYHVGSTSTYFRITDRDTLIVYVNGKRTVYSKAGVFAVRVLRNRLERLK